MREEPLGKSKTGKKTFRILFPTNAQNMKALFIEPLLVVASSLVWLFVLPLAAVIRVGLAILDRVVVLKPRGISFALLG